MPQSASDSILTIKQRWTRMTHEGDRFTPIEENVRIYDKLYKEVYLKMYDRLSPLYGSIRKHNRLSFLRWGSRNRPAATDRFRIARQKWKP